MEQSGETKFKTEGAGAAGAGGGEVINLVVKDQNGTEVHFKVKTHTKLEKLMNAYCQKKSIQLPTVRFLFDGERIQGDSTPADLNMEDGDAIDCVIEQLGGL